MPVVVALLKERTTAQWQERLAARDILHAPVRTYGAMLTDEQIKVLNALAWIEQDGLPATYPLANIPGAPVASPQRSKQSPHVGEHTVEILRESGIDAASIDKWLAEGIVKAWTPANQAAPAAVARQA